MINNIGINLMTRYLLPFEAISVLLMMALVGAAHLSRKEGIKI
jgi:NADH:ubiquinone oxidoreductase subunit 6 (subunit J)